MLATTPVVTLNVSGKLFYSTRSTLNKSPFFKAMLDQIPSDLTPTESLFIDRDARAFKHILALLREPTYPFPKRLKHELDFYGLAKENKEPGTEPKQSLKSTPIKKYTLFDDIFQLPAEEQEAARNSPIQIVPMSEALPMVSFISGGFGRMAMIRCMVSNELQTSLQKHGCSVGTTTTEFKININTQLFVSDFVKGEIKLINEHILEEMWTQREKTHVLPAIVPVLKTPQSNECAAILVVTSFPQHKFQ